jgi:WAS/WASL-interacting protein
VRTASSTLARPNGPSPAAAISRVPSPPLTSGSLSFSPSTNFPPPRAFNASAASQHRYPSGASKGTTFDFASIA